MTFSVLAGSAANGGGQCSLTKHHCIQIRESFAARRTDSLVPLSVPAQAPCGLRLLQLSSVAAGKAACQLQKLLLAVAEAAS